MALIDQVLLMRTAGQNFARRRRLASRADAVARRDWYVVGWLDRRLNCLEYQCPFGDGEPERDAWLAGFRAADKEQRERGL